MTRSIEEMFLDIAEGKTAQAADDGSVSIYQGPNVVYFKPDEVEKLRSWLNKIAGDCLLLINVDEKEVKKLKDYLNKEVIPDGGS